MITGLLLLWACVREPPPGSATGLTTDPPDPGAGESTPLGTGDLYLDVVGFNVESGGADPAIVASEVIAAVQGEHAWGLSEVTNELTALTYVDAAADAGGAQFDYVIGTTTWEDLLVLAWDPDRLRMESYEELHAINPHGSGRAPLVGTMTDLDSGTAFLLMVNHLWRTDDDARHEQAALLNAWAREQTLPIVMVGDYNLDWDVPSGGASRDAGYDLLTADGVLEWVRPAVIETTQCSTWYDSVLDFTFVGGEARSWEATAELVPVAEDYCRARTDERSDHKPVRAVLRHPAAP